MPQLRFISPLVVLLALTLTWSGCVRDTKAKFVSASTATAPAIPEGFGVNIDFTDPRPGEMAMLSRSGVRWVRMDLVWEATEKESGRYDFAAYDRLLTALETERLHALFILDYGNPLYGTPPRTEAARQAFARWAVAAAKHFAGRGVLWEIYNEPNQSTFWPAQPNVDEYVQLALTVGRAFKASVPNEKLIGPATSEIDFEFVESCLKAGLLEYWSAVSVHPYRRNDPETAAQDYLHLRELIKRYGEGATKNAAIISSEWGYSAAWLNVNEEKQGELLARAWLTNLANDISLTIWYDWRDDGVNPNEAEHHFGMVSNAYHQNRDPVYDPKPTYLAAKTLTAFFNGYRFDGRLEVGGPDDYVLTFRKGTELRFAAWTTSKRASVVLLPLSVGRVTAIKHNGIEAGALSADQKGLLISLTTSPIYLRSGN